MPEEATRAGSGDEGEEGGTRPTGSVAFLTFSLQGKRQACFLLSTFTLFYVRRFFFGGRRQGRPTRIDHVDLGQDMVR